MGKRIFKVKMIANAQGWLKPITTQVLRVIDKPATIKLKRGLLLPYNPSVGRLRAWADPFKEINGTIGVLY